MLESARQLVETDREEWGRVKALEHLAGGGPLEVAAVGAHHPAAAKGRLEERQAVYMIEVQMAEQDVDLGGGIVAVERREAGAGVNDDKPRPAANFDTRSPPPEFRELGAGHRNGASHPPEPDMKGIL